MSELLSLQSFVDAAGDEEGISFGKKGGYEDPFKYDLAYPVEITEQEIETTKNGYTQVKLKLSTVRPDGSYGASSSRWISLPVFSAEKARSEDATHLRKLRSIFGEQLHQLLRAVDSANFFIARMEKIGTTWHFYAANGDEMSKQEKNAREKDVGKAVIGAASLMAVGDFSLVGKKVFYVRTQSKKDATKSYDNWFSVQPDKYAAAEV